MIWPLISKEPYHTTGRSDITRPSSTFPIGTTLPFPWPKCYPFYHQAWNSTSLASIQQTRTVYLLCVRASSLIYEPAPFQHQIPSNIKVPQYEVTMILFITQEKGWQRNSFKQREKGDAHISGDEKENKELLMSSGDLENQKLLWCWKMTQNQVCKGEGEMGASNRKTLTEAPGKWSFCLWGLTSRMHLSFPSLFRTVRRRSLSLGSSISSPAFKMGLKTKRNKQADDSQKKIPWESRTGLEPKLMITKSKLSDSWLSLSSPEQ